MLAAMPSDKVEFLERIYEAWGVGDFRRDPGLPDEFTLVMHSSVPEAGTYAGREHVARYMKQFLQPWERLTIVAEEMTERGDKVLVRVLQTGIGGTSGATAAQQLFNLWTFEANQPFQMKAFTDEAAARSEFDES